MSTKNDTKQELTRCPKCDTILDEEKTCGMCGVDYSSLISDVKVYPLPDIEHPEPCGVCGAMMTGTRCDSCKMPESDISFEINKHKIHRMITIDFLKRVFKTKWLGFSAEEKTAIKVAYNAIKSRHIYDSVTKLEKNYDENW